MWGELQNQNYISWNLYPKKQDKSSFRQTYHHVTYSSASNVNLDRHSNITTYKLYILVAIYQCHIDLFSQNNANKRKKGKCNEIIYDQNIHHFPCLKLQRYNPISISVLTKTQIMKEDNENIFTNENDCMDFLINQNKKTQVDLLPVSSNLLFM